MRPRELILLSGIMALLGIAGLFVLGRDAYADVVSPAGSMDTAPAVPGAGEAAPPPQDDPRPAEATAPTLVAAPLAAPVAARANGPRLDTSGWTKGVVKGDIQLAVSVLDRIRSITVEVVEARNPVGGKLPTRLIVPVERGNGTPTFEVHDVPFSEYPYVVSVLSPGLNGSRRTLTIDAATPLADDLVLSITPGTPFTILVRDQDTAPFTGVDLTLQPIGEPAGRPPQSGTTDNFGSLVFEDVLAGDYHLFANQAGQALVPPRTVTVQPGGYSRVQGQSHTLVIERGVPVQVKVHDRNFFPYVDAVVTATATDRIKLTVQEKPTDQQGVATFAHLQPGTWQITVTKEGFHLWDKQITLKPYQDPVTLDATLVPVRR